MINCEDEFCRKNKCIIFFYFSQTSERDSLDENILVDESYSPKDNTNNPTLPTENNDYNVYQQLHKISNSQLLGKKLETTEL